MTKKQKLFLDLAKSGAYKVPAKTPEEKVLKQNLADEVLFNPIRIVVLLLAQIILILIVIFAIDVFFF